MICTAPGTIRSVFSLLFKHFDWRTDWTIRGLLVFFNINLSSLAFFLIVTVKSAT